MDLPSELKPANSLRLPWWSQQAGCRYQRLAQLPLGYEFAQQFGIKVRKCRPALVPLTFNAEDKRAYCDLAGVATEVVRVGRGQQFREKLLITHRGLSGPAILQISSYWKRSEAIVIDLAPGIKITTGYGNMAHAAILRPLNPHYTLRYPFDWRSDGSNSIRLNGGPIPLSMKWSSRFITGKFARKEPKATKKPR